MARTLGLVLMSAWFAQTLSASQVHAQAAEAQAEPEMLQTLPHPPLQPRSLLEPPPPLGPPPPDLERSYFRRDPLLDPPGMPPVGWFANVDVGVLKPHLQNQVIHTVVFSDGSTATVGLPGAHLSWTVSPRFELGYRLPSGFGEVSMAYRFLVSQGTNAVVVPDGLAALKSRLDVNVAELNWASQEFTPWNLWDMKVHFGLRYSYVYFDSQANEPFAEAAAGSGIVASRTTDSYVGFGPHAGLDLSRRIGWGLAILGRFDASTALGRIRQKAFASTTTAGADGLPQSADVFVSGSQSVPTVLASLGLSWHSPACGNIHLFAGYQFEYWWNVGRYNPTAVPPASQGEFFDSGIALRAEINF